MIQTFTIEGHTARLNQLLNCHWRTKHRLRTRDSWLVAIACRNAYIALALGKRRVGLTVHLAKGQRAPDVDSFWKSLLDGLVAAKVLVDDSPRWCELGPVEYARTGTAAMVVTLEDVQG